MNKTSSEYFPIPLSSLQVDTVTGFELYLEVLHTGEPVLFRGKDVAFSEAVRDRLVDSKVSHLLIDTKQKQEFARYVERNLGAIVRNPDIPPAEKSEVLYGSVQNLLAEVIADPRSGQMIQRSKAAVESSVHFLQSEPAALECLLEVASYDYYTYTHSVNVFVFSLSLARRAGYTETEFLEDYGQGLLLHDIGKSRIDPAIINCKGKLSPEQWEIMRMHPVYGHEILLEHGGLAEVALDVTRHHHEKLGGGGYPDGLKGDPISPFVRICTIADIFDALTTRRSYKDAMGSFPALKLMRDEMLEHIDKGLFGTFVEMMANPRED